MIISDYITIAYDLVVNTINIWNTLNSKSGNSSIHTKSEVDNKIIYIRHSNRGQSESINRGVLISVGEYITILDSDDEYKPNHLSACLTAIDSYDLICSTSLTIVDDVMDYYVPDKNDLTKLIHLDNSVLFGTLFTSNQSSDFGIVVDALIRAFFSNNISPLVVLNIINKWNRLS